LGSRHLTLLVDLPRASLELAAQHLLASLSFRPAAPHQQCCWLVHLPVPPLVQRLLLLVLKLLLQLAKGTWQWSCAHVANAHAEDETFMVHRNHEMMISEQQTWFCRGCISMVDFDLAVLVGTYMLCICTYVCFGKLVLVFGFAHCVLVWK